MSEKFAVNDESLVALIKNNPRPVLIDFWASWCGPCTQLLPKVDELANEMAAKVTIRKLNIEAHPVTPTTFGVKAIPNLILFNDGVEVARHIGPITKEALKAWILENLPAPPPPAEDE